MSERKKRAMTIRKNSLTYKMLKTLYYVHIMRTKDLKQLGRNMYPVIISRRIRRLKELGFIEEDTETYSVNVVYITALGRLYVCDKESADAYENLYDKLIPTEFTKARQGKKIENLLDLNRARAMLIFHGVSVFENEKPILGELIKKLSNDDSIEVENQNPEYPPYKQEYDYENLQNWMNRGVFYSKREVIQYLETYASNAMDYYRGARFKGLFINSRRILMIYVQPFGKKRMFKLRYEDSIIKNRIDQIFGEKLLESYGRTVKVDSLVISDSQSFVHAMATGWKYGHMRPERKEAILKRMKNQEEKKLRKGEQKTILNAETGHEVLDDIEMASEFMKESNNNFSTPNTGLFIYRNSLFDNKFVIPGNADGLQQMFGILYRTDAEIYADGYEKFTGKAIDPATEVSFQDSLTWNVGNEQNPVLYMPVFEVNRLHKLSVDGDTLKEAKDISVITRKSMIDTISHCLRKNVKGIDIETMNPIEDVKLFDVDGYVTNAKDPYAEKRVPSKEKKKRIRNKARSSFEWDVETVDAVKKAAKMNNMSVNKYVKLAMREIAKKDIKSFETESEKE